MVHMGSQTQLGLLNTCIPPHFDVTNDFNLEIKTCPVGLRCLLFTKKCGCSVTLGSLFAGENGDSCTTYPIYIVFVNLLPLLLCIMFNLICVGIYWKTYYSVREKKDSLLLKKKIFVIGIALALIGIIFICTSLIYASVYNGFFETEQEEERQVVSDKRYTISSMFTFITCSCSYIVNWFILTNLLQVILQFTNSNASVEKPVYTYHERISLFFCDGIVATSFIAMNLHCIFQDLSPNSVSTKIGMATLLKVTYFFAIYWIFKKRVLRISKEMRGAILTITRLSKILATTKYFLTDMIQIHIIGFLVNCIKLLTFYFSGTTNWLIIDSFCNYIIFLLTGIHSLCLLYFLERTARDHTPKFILIFLYIFMKYTRKFSRLSPDFFDKYFFSENDNNNGIFDHGISRNQHGGKHKKNKMMNKPINKSISGVIGVSEDVQSEMVEVKVDDDDNDDSNNDNHDNDDSGLESTNSNKPNNRNTDDDNSQYMLQYLFPINLNTTTIEEETDIEVAENEDE